MRNELSETQQQLERMMGLLERVAANLQVDAPSRPRTPQT